MDTEHSICYCFCTCSLSSDQCVRAGILDWGRPGMDTISATYWLCDLVQVSFLVYKMRMIIVSSKVINKNVSSLGSKIKYWSMAVSIFLKFSCAKLLAVLRKALESGAHSHLPTRALVQ